MKRVIIAIFIVLLIGGCASTPYIPTHSRPLVSPDVPGIFHRIEKGQTLWRISKIYNVDLDEIIRINKISDVTNIEIGQLIFIPNRTKETPKKISYSSEDFIWPIRGRVIGYFGQTSNNIVNKGINIQPYSNYDVVAAKSGKVVFCNDNFGNYGKIIIIEHFDGFSTVYARNSQILIKTGDNVEKGSTIAKAGNTERDRNRYLHFEIRKGHIPKNPLFYLPG